MSKQQRVFNAISVTALVLAILLTGLFVSRPLWDDDETLAEQLRVLGYCPPGQALTPLDGATDSTDGVCTPLDETIGDLIPSADDTYTLGNSVFRWKSLQLGPGTLYIEDETTGKDVAITIDNGELLINGANSLRIGNIQLTSTGLRSLLRSQDITIGEPGDSGLLAVSKGIRFPDGTILTSAGGVGTAGTRGASGAPGNTGPSGDDGAQGAAGAVGPVGAQGPVGPMGPIGPAGPAGTFDIGGACSFDDRGTIVTGVLRWKVDGPHATLECFTSR